MHSYSNTVTVTAGKKFGLISSAKPDFPMIDNLSIVVHTIARSMLTLLSVDAILLPRYSTKS